MYDFIYESSEEDLGATIVIATILLFVAVLLFLTKHILIITGVKTRYEMSNFISGGVNDVMFGFLALLGFSFVAFFAALIIGLVLKFLGIGEDWSTKPSIFSFIIIDAGFVIYLLFRKLIDFYQFVMNSKPKPKPHYYNPFKQ